MSIEATKHKRVELKISSNPAFIDEEVAVRVNGLAPGALVTIHAQACDDSGRAWESHAAFQADAAGCVDTSAHESRGGTYRGRDAMGLFWSMRLAEKPEKAPATFLREGTNPDTVSLKVEIGRHEVAAAQLERRWLAPGTKVLDANEDGLVARLFVPPGRGPHRTVIVFGGSGGGYDLDKAAVLARHGFATLALAYFGIPPLPKWLHRIPLEYFARALAWLQSRPDLDAKRVGLLGISRGAELSLLLGSAFPEVGPVVAYAPSAVAWGSGGRDRATGTIIPCWTLRGEPVPFAPLPLRRFIARSAVPVGLLRRPVKFRNLFRSAFRNRDAVERAIIPVEKCRGPILLISGGDDHVWSAAQMAKMIEERMRARGLTENVTHLNYPRAGHALRYPHLPTTARKSRPAGLKYEVSFGGSAEADAEAHADSWPRAISFLHGHL